MVGHWTENSISENRDFSSGKTGFDGGHFPHICGFCTVKCFIDIYFGIFTEKFFNMINNVYV